MLSFLIHILFLIFLLILVAGLLLEYQKPLPTAAGGIVMSLGVMINDGFQQVPFDRRAVSLYVGLSLFILVLLFFYKYVRDAVNGVFYQRHLQHPVESFAAGTWVAGISVTVVSISKVLPIMKSTAIAMFALNLFLWFAYVLVVVRNYRCFWHARAHQPQLLNQVNGILLLACVAAQSIALSGSVVWQTTFPHTLALFIAACGLLFYISGVFLIIRRYLSQKPLNLADNWSNTNCIIHGALSITGLTITVGRMVSTSTIVVLWIVVLALLIIVEAMEILRGLQRIRRYGWKKGIFTYSVSQWSRNFTFGMFYAFTLNLPLNRSYLKDNAFLHAIKNMFIAYWKDVILVLFLFEVILFVWNYIEKHKEAAAEANA